MKTISPGGTIGIVGGGQLGRMTALAASRLGYQTHIFCPQAESPAAQVSNHLTCAAYDDQGALEIFAKQVDVVSFEFENVPNDTILFLEKFVTVRPRSQVLHTAQNRVREKTFFQSLDVPTTRFSHVTDYASLEKGFKELSAGASILKTVELGYDGKGQVILDEHADLEKAWQGVNEVECILEAFVEFDKEISVIVCRAMDGETLAYPAAENKHKHGILDTTIVPADISDKTEQSAKDMALSIANALEVVGLVAVEFFVLPDGSVMANEIAPRPHNSGHWTMDGCVTSQFEQFVRAICGLPLGSVALHSKVRMKNLIGPEVASAETFLTDPNAKLHLYGKTSARAGRKMGHINFVEKLG